MKSIILLIINLVLIFSIHGQDLQEIRSTTLDFLASLDDEQSSSIQFSFESEERTNWTNLPIGLASRAGLRYGELSEESRRAFHKVLTLLLSSQGYLKVTSIMRLDDILNEVYATWHSQKKIPDNAYDEIRSLNWDFENYFIAVWGNPDSKEPWGLRLEGHHISLNLSASDNEYSMTPIFLGTDPAEVSITKFAGLRVLSNEQDLGFKLLNSFTESQKELATVSEEAPADILTNPESPQRIDEYEGINGSDLTPKQKYYLERLILEYVSNLEFEKAHAYSEEIMSSDLNEVYFSWRGSHDQDKPHYYQINSPEFMIEYDNVGFQSKADHIHTIWREKGNDFGEDVLKRHYASHPHK